MFVLRLPKQYKDRFIAPFTQLGPSVLYLSERSFQICTELEKADSVWAALFIHLNRRHITSSLYCIVDQYALTINIKNK